MEIIELPFNNMPLKPFLEHEIDVILSENM